MSSENAYPSEAYAPDGNLWWNKSESKRPSNSKGSKPRAAAWLRFNVEIGFTFTTNQVREALGAKDEHFQRRLRELRNLGWEFDGMKDSPGLNAEYRLRRYGWWPGSENKKPKEETAVPAHTRRAVLERDGSRCVVCGVGASEPYPDPPHTPARMSIGHILAASHGGSNRLENLRCECARCNETVRAESGSGESSQDLIALARNLKASDRKQLLTWITQGRRDRSRLDVAHDRIRLAAPGVRDEVLSWLVERGSPQ